MHTLHQKEAHLRENGFAIIKHVRHGAIWGDGVSRITVSRSTKHAHEFLKDVKKAVELRESKKIVVPNPAKLGTLGDLPSLQALKNPVPDEVIATRVEPCSLNEPGLGLPVMTEEVKGPLAVEIVEVTDEEELDDGKITFATEILSDDSLSYEQRLHVVEIFADHVSMPEFCTTILRADFRPEQAVKMLKTYLDTL